MNVMLPWLGAELVKTSVFMRTPLTRCTALSDGSAPNSTVSASSVRAASPRKHDAPNLLTALAFVNTAIGGLKSRGSPDVSREPPALASSSLSPSSSDESSSHASSASHFRSASIGQSAYEYEPNDPVRRGRLVAEASDPQPWKSLDETNATAFGNPDMFSTRVLENAPTPSV